MFIIKEGTAYEITRESVQSNLQNALKDAFSTFKENLLSDVITEILNNLDLPDILYSNSVFVNKSNSFIEFNIRDKIIATGKIYNMQEFTPVYKGVECKEILHVLKNFEKILLSGRTFENTIFIDTDEGLSISSLNSSDFSFVIDILHQYFSNEFSQKVYTEIKNEIMHGSLFLAFVVTRDDTVLYSLDIKFCCQKIETFSVAELRRKILETLPNLNCVNKYSTKIATMIHNKFFYNSDISSIELSRPTKIKQDGTAVFKQTKNGIEFFLDLHSGLWISSFIYLNINQIDWVTDDTQSNFEIGFYKGFKIFGFSRPENTNITPINNTNEIQLCYSSRYKEDGYLEYLLSYPNDPSITSKRIKKFYTEDFRIGIRVYFE